MTGTLPTVSVIGLGYIGLPTAAIIASRNLNVIGVDSNPRVVEVINGGRIHIVEPDLDLLVRSAVTEGLLRAVSSPLPADVFLIAVPTPLQPNRKPDLGYVYAAAESIAPVLKQGDLVILESTCPVGTTESLAQKFAMWRPDLRFPGNGNNDDVDVNLAYCPERVLPGKIVTELINNDRIVGGLTEGCTKRAQDLYRVFVRGDILITDSRTAEMSKLVENSFRDVNVAFANELSMVCDELNIDVWRLIELANHHPRVNVLRPGAGVGGHCIAVDPWFVVSAAPESTQLIQAARQVNDRKTEWVIARIERELDRIQSSEQFAGDRLPVLALLGLSYKPDIDDLRESPALKIAVHFANHSGCAVRLVEPNLDKIPPELPGQSIVPLEPALKDADLVAVLVSHKEFQRLGSSQTRGQMLIDFAGLVGK